MVSRISELVLNCADPELLAGFWSQVLGYVELDREDGAIEIGPPDAGFGGLQPTIILSPSSNPRTGRLPLHIDVNPVDRDQDAELERLLALRGIDLRQQLMQLGFLAILLGLAAQEARRVVQLSVDDHRVGVLARDTA